MIRRLIRNIRSKPKPVRDNIAMVIAGVFTFAVFSVWMYHSPARFVSLSGDSTLTPDESGFSGFFDQVSGQFASLKEAVSAPDEAATTSEVEIVKPDMSTTSTAPVFDFSTAGNRQSDSEDTRREVRIITTSVSSSTAATSTKSE